MSTKQELTGSDQVTLLAALAIATERFPDATEYEDMRQRILKSSVVTIDTPDRELRARRASRPCPGCGEPMLAGDCWGCF